MQVHTFLDEQQILFQHTCRKYLSLLYPYTDAVEGVETYHYFKKSLYLHLLLFSSSSFFFLKGCIVSRTARFTQPNLDLRTRGSLCFGDPCSSCMSERKRAQAAAETLCIYTNEQMVTTTDVMARRYPIRNPTSACAYYMPFYRAIPLNDGIL